MTCPHCGHWTASHVEIADEGIRRAYRCAQCEDESYGDHEAGICEATPATIRADLRDLRDPDEGRE